MSECGDCRSAENKDFFRRLSTTASRMDRLVTDALSYSQTVRQRLPQAPVGPIPQLHYLLESYPNLQPFRAHIRIQPPIARVLANEAGLTQCFSNLLGNAVKFTKPGVTPQIRVWAEEVRIPSEGDALSRPPPFKSDSALDTPHSALGSVRIWVEDNGIGIPKSFQARVFDMFQRGTNLQDGTGIGLAIVRKLTEQMGGKVGVQSEPGAGSRFWVELPTI
jgi:signal transduction histidine kinase